MTILEHNGTHLSCKALHPSYKPLSTGSFEIPGSADYGCIKKTISVFFVISPVTPANPAAFLIWWLHLVYSSLHIPVVPHKAVAEVSKIGNL